MISRPTWHSNTFKPNSNLFIGLHHVLNQSGIEISTDCLDPRSLLIAVKFTNPAIATPDISAVWASGHLDVTY